jgi:radical SAM superfamily enzyme YgiQ (UPF0313 family)
MLTKLNNLSYKWKKILLINPNYTAVGWDYFNIKFPPLNLMYIASYLTDLDVEVEILDTKINDLNYDQIKKKIKVFNPDIVGITVYVSAVINQCYDIAKLIKEVNPNCKVVFGGRHPTFEADEILKTDNVDFVVRGEGELTFRELVKKNKPDGIQGISFKSNEKIIHNPDRPLMSKEDFANIRLPARNLTINNKYKIFTVRMEAVETSRGCPFTCKFCTSTAFYNHTWRPRKIEKIITELKLISRNRKITDIFFVDDNLTANTQRIEELCEKIIECKKNKEINDFKFFAQLRVDDVVRAPQMVRKMAEAGFWVVFIGIESINETALKNMRKGFSFNKVLSALKILHSNNVIVAGLLIIGVDLNATKEDVINEIKFIKKVDIDLVNYVLLTPFLGTETLRELTTQNLVVSRDWSKYTIFYPVIKTYQLTPEQLYDLLLYSFKELDIRNNLKRFIYRIIKRRGIIFVINPVRILSLAKSYFKLKIFSMKKFKKL